MLKGFDSARSRVLAFCLVGSFYLCSMLKNVLLEAVEAGAKVIQYYFNTKNLQISNIKYYLILYFF